MKISPGWIFPKTILREKRILLYEELYFIKED